VVDDVDSNDPIATPHLRRFLTSRYERLMEQTHRRAFALTARSA
jgi:hypothetical protein